MARPQQPELARSAKTDLDPDHVETGLQGQKQPATGGETGPIPADNQPGHHPPEEQDKPDLDAFAEKLGTKPSATEGSQPATTSSSAGGKPAEPSTAGGKATGFSASAAARPTAVSQPGDKEAARSVAAKRPAAKTTEAPSAPTRPAPIKSAPAKSPAAKSAPAKSAPAKQAPPKGTPQSAPSAPAPSAAAPSPQDAVGVSVPQPPPERQEPEPRLVTLAMLPLRTTVTWLEHLDHMFTERLMAKYGSTTGDRGSPDR